MLSAYSAKWFAVYYFCLGILGVAAGIYCLVRSKRMISYIQQHMPADNPPIRLKIFLRYFLVFTLPTLGLSFFPFSIIELSFSVWCLFMIYLLGSVLLRWKSVYPLLMEQTGAVLKKYIRITGAIMLSLGGIMFVLFYRIIEINF